MLDCSNNVRTAYLTVLQNNVINGSLLLNVNCVVYNVLRKGKERKEYEENYFFHFICFQGLKFFVQGI